MFLFIQNFILKMDISSLVLNALATPLTLCSFDLFVATIKWWTWTLKDYNNQPSFRGKLLSPACPSLERNIGYTNDFLLMKYAIPFSFSLSVNRLSIHIMLETIPGISLSLSLWLDLFSQKTCSNNRIEGGRRIGFLSLVTRSVKSIE